MKPAPTLHAVADLTRRRINSRRSHVGYNPREIAGLAGISLYRVRKILEHRATPNIADVRALAMLFRCSTDYLLGFKVDP